MKLILNLGELCSINDYIDICKSREKVFNISKFYKIQNKLTLSTQKVSIKPFQIKILRKI